MSLIKMNGISSFAWWIFRFSCIFAIFALICALGNPQNGYTIVFSTPEKSIYERIPAPSAHTRHTPASGVGVFRQRAQACLQRMDDEQDSFLAEAPCLAPAHRSPLTR